MFFGLSLLILGLSQVNCIQVDNLEVAIDRSTGSYQIFLSNNLWLNSGPVYVRNDGATLSSENHTLILRGVDSTWDITDEWGHFRTETFHWKTLDESFSFDTYMNIYTDIPVVVFGQLFVDGAAKTALPDTSSAISSFPTFLVQDTGVERGYLTYAGGQLSKTIVGRWTPEDNIFHGVDGGFPIALFDHKKRYILEIFMQNALVMSPLNTFMSAATTSWLVDDETPALGFGIISTVDKIPKGYAYETILVAGQNVTGTMDSWGELLRSKYKKDDSFRKRDYSINYLGYWTDNGACYYYYTGDYANYEDALVAVKEDADRQGIPFRYLQLDSWWYFKDDKGGVKNWTAMPDVFPNGIEAVVKKTGWPIVAHNRFWSSQAVYAQRNGGLFDFIIDDADDIALPNDPKFWPYLLSNAQQQWNLWVYEQDWLFTEFSTLRELQTELNLGYVWLKQMGDAAQDLDLTIQYCMSWTRHALQSVEISTVTQIRVSGDYHPGNDQWMIGDSTILAHSLGLAAFKDNFHTTSTQAKCKFTDKEPNPVLETYIAALSGGPVGPSDAVGGANKTLIMATCMADGRLLKPTRPAMSLDKSFIYRAFGVGDIDGEVYSAYSEVAGLTWYYVLVADLKKNAYILGQDLPPSSNYKPRSDYGLFVAARCDLNGNCFDGQNFTGGSSIRASATTPQDFQYWIIAPFLPGLGTAVFGELNKIVTMSETRFTDITFAGSEYIFTVTGTPGEIVTLSIFGYYTRTMSRISCKVSSAGTINIHLTYQNVHQCT